jgi:hypothetical protein
MEVKSEDGHHWYRQRLTSTRYYWRWRPSTAIERGAAIERDAGRFGALQG